MSRYIPENLYALNAQNFNAIELPVIKEQRGKEWIKFGAQNLFPQELIEYYNTSAMHGTAVNAISDAITGEGILNIGSEYMNTTGETLDEVFEKIALDYVLFGSYAVNIIWNKEGTRITEMYHIPVANVRSGKIDEETQKVEEYWYSLDWANERKYKAVSFKSFDPFNNKKDNASQIYYCFKYQPGNNVYAYPSYISGLTDIDVDARISRFHSANLQNGLAPSMFLKFNNGIPSEDERRTIYREIENSFSGETNSGRYFLSFADSPEKSMQVETIENANTDLFSTIETRIASRILTAHRITSGLLLGIKEGTGFSSNADEIKVAYGHFLGTVVAPKQKKITHSLQYLLKFMGLTFNIEVIPSKIILEEEVTEEIIKPDTDASTIN